MGKDPAFLFYPADAAEDVSHMNRLERGCYFDILQAQKKFGRLDIQLIKKVLSHDFETCWESIKICLSYVDDMYFIEWLENSIQKRKAYSESRKNNRKGIKNEDMSNTCKTYDDTYVEHMGNENIIVNKKEKEVKHRYGEYRHVLLTDKQFKKIGDDYGETKRDEMIKNLDEGIQMKGYKYSDHNLAMRKWEGKPVKESQHPKKREFDLSMDSLRVKKAFPNFLDYEYWPESMDIKQWEILYSLMFDENDRKRVDGVEQVKKHLEGI